MSIAEKLTIIAENEQKVYDAGFNAGKSQGGDSYYDEFWDKFQDNGNRTNYQYGFSGYGWTLDTFKPKYSVVPDTLNTGFWGLDRNNTNIENAIDFVELFENKGLVFDTSNCSNFAAGFMWATIKRLGVIDLRKNNATMATTFGYGKIKTIVKVIVDENTTFQANTFQSQATLENITFEGVLAQNGLNLQWSTKLTHDSITSIVNCLSADTSGLTVTLSLTAVKKAFETSSGANDGNASTEWLNLKATKPNWTISFV
jgi:hypothetical protein